MLQLEIPLATVLQILRAASRARVPVLLNPAPAVPLPDDAYPCVRHLIVNESEAALLAGAPEDAVADPARLEAVARSCLDRGVSAVVVTLGRRGVYYATADKTGLLPAEPATVVDTTAAGDTFVGAYAVRVAHTPDGAEADVEAAVRWANHAAARAVEREGAQSAIPWQDEVLYGNDARVTAQ